VHADRRPEARWRARGHHSIAVASSEVKKLCSAYRALVNEDVPAEDLKNNEMYTVRC
jgi:hypothetical protein